MNYFKMIDQNDLKLWEPLEADSYQTTGAHGCETWFSYQARVVRDFAEIFNTTLKWVRED